MKVSLRSKILILSLTSLVVIGTGCERRGRVPQKAPAGNDQPSGSPEVNTAAKADEAAKKEQAAKAKNTLLTGVGERTMAEKLLMRDADLPVSCTIAINDREVGTTENFATDYKSLMTLTDCLKEGGIVMNAAGDGVDTEVLTNSFYDLAKGNGNHESAKTTLNSRMNLFKFYAELIDSKYSTSKPLSDEFVAVGADGKESKLEIGASLKEIATRSAVMSKAILEVNKIAENATVSQPKAISTDEGEYDYKSNL